MAKNVDYMDLKEFISKTISDIIEGIDCASRNLKGSGRQVGLYSTGKSNQRHVEFDVAVVASTKNRTGANIGGEIGVIGVAHLGSRIQGISEKLDSSVSRIKFGVRIKEDVKK